MVALLGLCLLSEVSIGGSGHVVFTRALVGGSPLVPLVAGAGPYRALGHSHSPGRGVWSYREVGVHVEKSSHHFTPPLFIIHSFTVRTSGNSQRCPSSCVRRKLGFGAEELDGKCDRGFWVPTSEACNSNHWGERYLWRKPVSV